ESLCVLAGGIAHDFNNILTAILGNISMAKMHGTKSAEKTERFLKQAIKAAEQTRALTNQLLTFARGGNPIKENASIVDLVQESSEFVARGSGIRCKYHIGEDIHVVAMDVGQISQVVNNLVINAIQAMQEGGTIRIYISNTSVADNEESTNSILRPGDYVSIAIQDQGTGIPEDILPKIFDPYFTTKDSGNGLGLASCYSIIRKHDGHIEVDSTPNVGTTFTIFLPAAREQIIEKSSQEDGGLVEGDSRVLVMDDESFIRDVAGQMLDYLGFEVAFSADGNEAIQLYRQAMEEGEKFDIVMLDITIPGGMGGKEAIKHLKELDPNVRAIVASGYSKDPVMEKYKEFGFRGRILKPFGIKELNKAFQDLN
ncbi:MAG: ATP-binding protein, partial [Calditrichota bacterium]